MKKAILQRLLSLWVLLLSSCSLIIPPLDNGIPPVRNVEPAQINTLLTKLADVEKPDRKPIVATNVGGIPEAVIINMLVLVQL